MEKSDQELLLRIADFNPHLKQLYEEHLKLNEEVEKLERYAAYSSSAALRHKQMKKEKLRGMDAIMSILNEYRVQ
jgi:uncharacterized protein